MSDNRGRFLAQPGIEPASTIRLPGGELSYTVRRSTRARRMRLTVHPDRGVVVSLPGSGRRGWAQPEGAVEAFLREREAWIRRHLARQAALRQRLLDRPEVEAGRVIPYLGLPHRVRLVAGPPGARSTRVVRVGGDDGDELVIERRSRDVRAPAAILEAWFRARARRVLADEVARHAAAIGVSPAGMAIRDPRTRWGSCSRSGTLSFSWRLILAPPEALDAVAVHEVCHLRIFGHGPGFHALVERHAPEHAAWRRWLRRNAAELHAALDPRPLDA